MTFIPYQGGQESLRRTEIIQHIFSFARRKNLNPSQAKQFIEIFLHAWLVKGKTVFKQNLVFYQVDDVFNYFHFPRGIPRACFNFIQYLKNEKWEALVFPAKSLSVNFEYCQKYKYSDVQKLKFGRAERFLPGILNRSLGIRKFPSGGTEERSSSSSLEVLK